MTNQRFCQTPRVDFLRRKPCIGAQPDASALVTESRRPPNFFFVRAPPSAAEDEVLAARSLMGGGVVDVVSGTPNLPPRHPSLQVASPARPSAWLFVQHCHLPARGLLCFSLPSMLKALFTIRNQA